MSAQKNPLNTILATLSAVTGSLWFGITVAQSVVAYDLFFTGTATLRPLDVNTQLTIIRTVSNLSVVSLCSYLILLLSFSAYCIRQRHRFRLNAYFMMVSILGFISLPPTLFLGYLNWRLFQQFPDHYSLASTNSEAIVPYFTRIYTTYSWMNFLSLAMFFTIVTLLIAKPLRQQQVPENAPADLRQ